MAKIAPHASILPATHDGVFKSLLTQDSPASAIVLADLVSSIIGYRVEKVAIRGNEPAITDIQETRERLDVNCIAVDTGEQFDVEMQATRMQESIGAFHKNLRNRLIYYASDLYSGQAVKKRNYAAPPRTFSDNV